MPWDPSTYDDDRELTLYIWDNYRHLLTPFESKVWNTVVWEEKAEKSSDEMASMIRRRNAAQNDPRIDEAIRRGFPLFRREARDRILAEHAERVFVNRCARCQCVVARPTSRQCLWCGHDWHEPGRPIHQQEG